MQAPTLSHSPARPRSVMPSPKYPGVAGLTLALFTSLSCAAPQAHLPRTDSPMDAASRPPTTIVIRAAQTPESLRESEPTGRSDLRQPAAEQPIFPVDKAPLPLVGCGGGCPPSYQLGADSKDVEQIRARIAYCIEHEPRPIDAEGTLVVHVEINGRGTATRVSFQSNLTAGSVSSELTACVEALVRRARFHAERSYARQHDVEHEFQK